MHSMNRETTQLLDLVGLIYDAVLEPELWNAVLERTAGFVGGMGASIFRQDVVKKVGNAYYTWGMDLDYERLYFKKYIHINPLLPSMLTVDVGRVSSSSEQLPPAERPEQRQARPERSDRPEQRPERGPRRDDPRRNDRGRRGGRWDDEIGEFHHADNVIGFGDYVPDFMQVVPFPNGIPPLTPESDFEEEPVRAVVKPVAERRPERERGRRRPAKPVEHQPVEAPASETEVVVSAEPVVEAVQTVDAEKPVKPKRAPRAKAAPKAEEPKAKAPRARKPKVVAADAQPEAPIAEEAPAADKPKRARTRKKAAPEGDPA